MADRDWGVDVHNRPAFWERLGQRPFAAAWDPDSGETFAGWRRRARALFHGLLPEPPGGTAPRTAAPLLKVDVRKVVNDLVFERVVLDGPWCDIPGLVLRPRGEGPFPAVLLLHDHGSRFDIGKEKLVCPPDDDVRRASAEEWTGRFYGGRFVGEDLARRGYLVLATDALGWGERQGNGYESQQALACNLMLLGATLAGVIAREDMAAAAALRARKDVSRVAALGFSFGGVPRLAGGRPVGRRRRRRLRQLDGDAGGAHPGGQQPVARAVGLRHDASWRRAAVRLSRHGRHRRAQAAALLRRLAGSAVSCRQRGRRLWTVAHVMECGRSTAGLHGPFLGQRTCFRRRRAGRRHRLARRESVRFRNGMAPVALAFIPRAATREASHDPRRTRPP